MSNSIAKLEEELGERVFSRTTRAVRLSPFGATLLPPRRGAGPASPSVVLDSLADETFVMVPDRCGLARTTRTLFASVGMTLRAYAGEAMSYRVLEEWAALDLGAAILPQSRLSDRAAAVPLMLEPGVPAVLTSRAVWHGG